MSDTTTKDVEEPPLISSPEFVQYCHYLLDLHFAMQAGDEDKAEELRDKMDTPGWNMSGLELQASKLLSGDLYDMEEVLRGTRTGKEHEVTRLRRKKYEFESMDIPAVEPVLIDGKPIGVYASTAQLSNPLFPFFPFLNSPKFKIDRKVYENIEPMSEIFGLCLTHGGELLTKEQQEEKVSWSKNPLDNPALLVDESPPVFDYEWQFNTDGFRDKWLAEHTVSPKEEA
ncbi:MAG: hypothetical protein ACRYFS_03575 [Janthinobacterium lividum]